ncbi:MAG: hypothetical protein HYZ50_18490 [Deltaproteobacteria bacterium]|nr:hypothetical protein [Deltaproteobacteria bacterium]
MRWKAMLVVEKMRDKLASRAQRLVNETCIYKEGGLSLAQVHHLVVAVNQIWSLQGMEQYIREATGRSRPKDLTHAQQGKGEAWKKACPTRQGNGWQFFGERLLEEAAEIFADARSEARSGGAEEAQQRAAAMACLREFVGYLAWYFTACKNCFSLPAAQTKRE